MSQKKFRSWLEYFFFRAVLVLFRILPYRFGVILIKFIALFAGTLLRIRYRVAKDNLESVFPEKSEKEIKQIIRSHYLNLAVTAYETFIAPATKEVRTEIEGWENLEGAFSKRRGLLLVSGHFGNWEYAARYLAQQGLPINVVIKKLRNTRFNDYVNNLREEVGIKIIYKSRTMRSVFRALKSGEVVVMLVDQDAGKEGMLLQFLGRAASVFTGYARIAAQYDSPVILGICIRKRTGSYRLVFDSPLIPSEFKKDSKSYQKITEYVNRRLEDYVKEYPEQWFWVHRRWKGFHKAKQPE